MVTPDPPRRRAQQWRDQARAALRAAADPLPDLEWAAAGAARVTLSEHVVLRTQTCPAAGAADADADDFTWSAPKAARTLGVAALRELSARSDLTPFAAVVRAAEDDGAVGTGLADWIAGLEEGGRTAVLQRATTVCIAVREQLRRWPPDGEWGGPDARLRSMTLDGRPVRLRARYDLRGGRRTARTDTTHYALVDTATPESRRSESLAGHVALVATLGEGSVPSAVSLLHLRSGGRTTVEVTDAVLDEALTRCVDALAAVVSAREAVPPETRPGPACRHCRRVGDCVAGRSWLDGPGRRQGGLLPEGVTTLV